MPPKKYIVFWTNAAKEDLIDIIEYISSDSIDNAYKIYQKIKNNTVKLESLPFRSRFVPELKFHNIENYHEIIISPWRVIYRIEDNKVYILAVFDGRRNIEDLLLKRLING